MIWAFFIEPRTMIESRHDVLIDGRRSWPSHAYRVAADLRAIQENLRLLLGVLGVRTEER